MIMLLNFEQTRFPQGLSSSGNGRGDRARWRRRRDRRPRLEALETRQLLSAVTVADYPTTTANASPQEITAGPDGSLWFTEANANKIGTINPATHAVTEFTVPTAASVPTGITAGPDGNLWFTELLGNKIGMINPTTHAVVDFPVVTANARPNEITAGPDGNLWFTELAANKIGMINPTTHAVTEFPVVTANAYLQGITTGPDGNVWFTETNANKIGMINPTTGVVAEFPVTTSVAMPNEIAAGADGNLWFAEFGANKIGMINPTTHVVTEFPVPTASSLPYGMTAGPDGNLWFTEKNTNKVGTINPITHGIVDYAVPTAASAPYAITAGPDGNVWFTEVLASKIGVVTPATHLAVTTQPPTTVAPNAPFSVSVALDYDTGQIDTSYNGPVTITLASNPGSGSLGGTLTVTAQKGVATFSGLAINNEAEGYRLMAYTDPLTTTLTGPINVATPATIIGEKVIMTGRGRRRRVVGYELDFNEALGPATAQNLGNYVLSQLSGPKRRRRAHRLGFTVTYDDTTHSVTLELNGRARFAQGGTLLVQAQPPGGITSAKGAQLIAGNGQMLYSGDLAFTIARRGRQITAYNGATPPVA